MTEEHEGEHTDEVDPPVDTEASVPIRAGETLRIRSGEYKGAIAVVHAVFVDRLRVILRSRDGLRVPIEIGFDHVERNG